MGGAKFVVVVVVVKTRVCLQQNKTFASLRVCVYFFCYVYFFDNRKNVSICTKT